MAGYFIHSNGHSSNVSFCPLRRKRGCASDGGHTKDKEKGSTVSVLGLD